MMKKRGFTPLETIVRQRKNMVSLTGFTLMEVMIALFVLGLGLVGLFNLFPLAWQSLSYSRKLNEVVTLAENKLEELKAGPQIISSGQTCGTEGDLNWTISTQPLKLSEDIEVTYVELQIDFSFQKQAQTQRFITYLYGD